MREWVKIFSELLTWEALGRGSRHYESRAKCHNAAGESPPPDYGNNITSTRTFSPHRCYSLPGSTSGEGREGVWGGGYHQQILAIIEPASTERKGKLLLDIFHFDMARLNVFLILNTFGRLPPPPPLPNHRLPWCYRHRKRGKPQTSNKWLTPPSHEERSFALICRVKTGAPHSSGPLSIITIRAARLCGLSGAPIAAELLGFTGPTGTFKFDKHSWNEKKKKFTMKVSQFW